MSRLCLPPAPHLLTDQMLRAIGAGSGGPGAIGLLATMQHSRRRMFARLLPDVAADRGHREAAVARRAFDVLARIEDTDPGTVRAVLCYPAVGSWLARTVTALVAGDSAGTDPGGLALAAAAAAVRARVPVRVDLGHAAAVTPLALPSLGRATLPTGDELRVLVDGDRVSLRRGGGTVRLPVDPLDPHAGWSGLRRLRVSSRGLRLDAVLDTSTWWPPLASAGRGRGGGAARLVTDLSEVETRRWYEPTAAGWRLLVRDHADVAAEIAAAIIVLVPLTSRGPGMVSGTFRDAFGAVAMSPPVDARSAALALAHEVQHAKLTAIADAFPLVTADAGRTYYAPWRADRRPLAALLHGTYAHLGVTAFWRIRRQVERSPADRFTADVEFDRWRRATWDACDRIADSDGLTPVGRIVVEQMRTTAAGFLSERVPRWAAARAADLLADHRSRHTPG